jgi:hypothetical protein
MNEEMHHFATSPPSFADIEFLEDRLYDFYIATTGVGDGGSLGVFLRDEAHRIVAGAAGY